MRLYLSSFKLGQHVDKLLSLYGKDRSVGYIANALNHVSDKHWLSDWVSGDIELLTDAGLDVRPLDLRDYFSPNRDIADVISDLGGIWISGGNVFVLRQAMKLSGLDAYLLDGQQTKDLVYGAYSAGCCVLSPTLAPYARVDDPGIHPYPEIQTTLWDGLDILDFAFMPHFQSQHSESDLIDKGIAYCVDRKIPYRAFRDGEVLVL